MTDQHRRQVSAHYDALAANGPYATLAPHNRGGRKSRYVAAVFDAALLPCLRHYGRFARLLDFGCGTGIFTVQASDYGAEVVGIDVSFAMLQSAAGLARSQGRAISLTMTDGLRLPFSDAVFDRFAARESLCYVTDEQLDMLLLDVRRVLVSGAKIFVLDQVSENPDWQISPGAPNLKKRSVDEILGAFKRVGFDLVEAVPVRQPRFIWIYAVWCGLLPRFLTPWLARMEVLWNRYLCGLYTRRWHNVLFVFKKP